MKYLDPRERSLYHLIISLSGEAALVLQEMASEMDASIDELVSAILEDSVASLSKPMNLFTDVVIPDKCSKEDLLKSMED